MCVYVSICVHYIRNIIQYKYVWMSVYLLMYLKWVLYVLFKIYYITGGSVLNIGDRAFIDINSVTKESILHGDC